MIITAGKFKSQKIIAPDENITRPTLSKVRMAIFNTLQSLMDYENKTFLDMFAGSGIMGFEALSRGFKSVVAFEKNRKAANILRNNLKLFDKYQISYKLFANDCFKVLENSKDKFNCIYIDPPYYSKVYEQSLNIAKNISDGIIIVEHVVEVDFSRFEVIKQKKYGDKFVTFLKRQ